MTTTAPETKLDKEEAPRGEHDEQLLVEGENMAMRRWEKDPDVTKTPSSHEYETLGYVIQGKLILHMGEGSTLLERGDSWRIPAKIEHRYEILEPLVAVEVTSPPARHTH